MKRKTLWLFAFLSLTLLFVACGEEEEEEEPVDPIDRCDAEDLRAFAEGSISVDEETTTFEVSGADSAPGRISANEIRIQLGSAVPPGGEEAEPVIMRIYDPNSPLNFATHLSELTESGPLELDVIDASEVPAGSQDLTSLDQFDCSIDDDATVCVQVGFDSAGDGILFDDDELVYNAIGGTVTIDGFDPNPPTFSAHFDVQLGRNVLTFGDDSTGHFEGCLRPRYQPDQDYWTLN